MLVLDLLCGNNNVLIKDVSRSRDGSVLYLARKSDSNITESMQQLKGGVELSCIDIIKPTGIKKPCPFICQ